MISDVNATKDERLPIRQGQPLAEVPPVPPVAPPPRPPETQRAAPPPAAPPQPPRDRFAASIHRMPRSWRWALGLALAVLSGVVAALIASFVLPQTVSVPMAVAAGVLALAAGFILSTWWATLVLAVATAMGAGVTIWASVMSTPGTSFEGLSGMDAVLVGFTWVAILGRLPLIVVLFVGNAIGWWRRVGTV